MKVTVLMLTYNHEKYIEEAIESVLMQKTNFKFELVIGEDCSTDNTRNIILEYQKRYPDIIKVKLQEKNTGGRKNFISTFSLCRGEYVALLEGDDYWIGENKLQKQVEYLDNNPDCSFCGHSYRRYYQELGEFLGDLLYEDNKFNLEDLLREDISNEPNKWYIRTLTMIFRKSVLDNPPKIWYEVPYGDYLLQILCLNKGYGGVLKEIMGVYRINQNSITQRNAEEFLNSNITLRKYILGYIDVRYRHYVKASIDNKILKKEYFQLVDKFNSNEYDKKILNYFEKNNFMNIAVYGTGNLCNLLLSKIENSNIIVSVFIDKYMLSSEERVILKPDEINNDLNVDAIVVTPFYDFDNIKNFLECKVKNIRIVSLRDVNI